MMYVARARNRKRGNRKDLESGGVQQTVQELVLSPSRLKTSQSLSTNLFHFDFFCFRLINLVWFCVTSYKCHSKLFTLYTFFFVGFTLTLSAHLSFPHQFCPSQVPTTLSLTSYSSLGFIAVCVFVPTRIPLFRPFFTR